MEHNKVLVGRINPRLLFLSVKREHNKGVSKFWVDIDRQHKTQQHYHRLEKNWL